MDRSQYNSRRQWQIIPEGSTLTVLWWKVKGGTGKVFTDFLADEKKRDRAEQEKDFRESMKGYGEVLQRKEMTTQEIEARHK